MLLLLFVSPHGETFEVSEKNTIFLKKALMESVLI